MVQIVIGLLALATFLVPIGLAYYWRDGRAVFHTWAFAGLVRHFYLHLPAVLMGIVIYSLRTKRASARHSFSAASQWALAGAVVWRVAVEIYLYLEVRAARRAPASEDSDADLGTYLAGAWELACVAGVVILLGGVAWWLVKRARRTRPGHAP